MKKLFVALAMLFVIANAAAVTVSITATNKGSSVSVSHYYSANSDGSYKAEGNGKVSYGSVEVNSEADYNAKGDFHTETRTNKGDWYGESSLDLNRGNVKGSVQAKVNDNIQVSQNFDVSAENTYDFRAITYVKKDTDINDNIVDMGAGALAAGNDTGTMHVEQSASSGSAKATQHFLQRGGTLSERGFFKAVRAYKNYDLNSHSAEEYAEAYVDWTNSVEVWQKAEVKNNVKAEQNVLASGDDDWSSFYTYAYTDPNTDGNWEEFAESLVIWEYPTNPVYGSIYQSAETGSAKTKMSCNLNGDIDETYIVTYTDYDSDGDEDDYAYIKVEDNTNDKVTFDGSGFADNKAYAEAHASIKDPDNDGWGWKEIAYNNERANTAYKGGSKSGDADLYLWADSSTPAVNDNP